MLKVKQPNPLVSYEVGNAFNPSKMYKEGYVLPNSYCTINTQTTGVVGRIDTQYIYPLGLIGDCGDGTLVLNYDSADIPENIDQIISDLDKNYQDDELDSLLPDLSQYDNESHISLDQALKIVDFIEANCSGDFYSQSTKQDLIKRINEAIGVATLSSEQTTHTHTHTSNLMGAFKQVNNQQSTLLSNHQFDESEREAKSAIMLDRLWVKNRVHTGGG